MAYHRTRLAPSPTGALHLGNARTFLLNWALARQQGWGIVLRIEDLDGPRIKPEASQGVIDTLSWLGIDWDEGPYYQSHDLTPYRQALARLGEAGAIYPCRCTRSEIEAASLSAPHGDQHELRYPGTCRPPEPTPASRSLFEWAHLAWRVRVPSGVIHVQDHFAGPQAIDVSATIGDFTVATKEGLPSYQLAVIVDDARQGVDRVVRGDDLLGSAPRQQLLYDRLDLDPRPEYWHLPLVVGADGRRLAKRHGDTRLDAYRTAGVSPERIVGLLAEWSGCGRRREQTAQEFAAEWSIEQTPRERVVFTAEDHQWLMSGPELLS